jgi:FAD/FMN-containing dehydrogenase
VTDYPEKKARLLAELGAMAPQGTAGFGLAKRTSNLFRDRAAAGRPAIDLSHFDRVIRIDASQGTVDAEGMIPYAALTDATLEHGAMPAVVPQLKSITLGGAVAGVGIEASSFRFGLVHDTVTALEVLTGDGRIVRCTADNEHRDLYFGFPNSYGTLGYALSVSARLVPIKPFVHLTHVRHTEPAACFDEIARHCAEKRLDFLDGTVFAPDELYLTLGRFVDAASSPSDYTYQRIYYRSIRERRTDDLTTRDYVWRWDTDWFWCSKNVYAQHPLVRRLLGRKRLNSVTYQRIMRWNSRWGITRALDRLRGLHTESVIQDVDIPLAHAAEFLEFLHREIGILPIWICPICAPDAAKRFPLYPLNRETVYVNFGFWDIVQSRGPRPAGALNRAIEREVRSLGGLKSLYSDSFYTEEEFWTAYDRNAYAALKARYDPAGALPDLYAKCVRAARPAAPRSGGAPSAG